MAPLIASRAVLVVVVALLISACGAEGSSDEPLTRPTLPIELSDRVLRSASSLGEGSEPVIADTREITFSDDSIDCPLGNSGLGGKTGYRVTVDVAEQRLSYLVTSDGEVLLCQESGVTLIEPDDKDSLAGPTTTLGSGGDDTDPQPPVDAVSPRALTPDLLDAILADAAKRAGVSREEVELTKSEEKVFNDSSLDCPDPGRFYTQVLTPGHRVLVEAGGETYDYRVNSIAGSVRLCE